MECCVVENTNITVNLSGVRGGQSYFDGGLLGLIGYGILAALLITFTLGFGTPLAICMLYKWQIKHTVIEGHRLAFIGQAGDLFVQWIKWYLLTLITFGIYGFWLGIKMEQWKVKNTVFAS